MSEQHTSDVVPEMLLQLGYRWVSQGGTDIILPPLCPIPAGSFLMGSDPQRDPAAWAIELPQHRVVTGAYALAKYPLTVAEYACAVRCGALGAPVGTWEEWMNWPVQLQELAYPVVTVRWTDALAYARWLSAMTGEPWRLPTEAEWEKAARGTDGRIYPWGNQFDPQMANTIEAGIGRSTPVYAYARGASPYGVMDLIGNVYEWCSSAWRAYPYDPQDGREDVQADVTHRITRGGAYYDYANNARAATRWPSEPQRRFGPKGVRLARGHA